MMSIFGLLCVCFCVHAGQVVGAIGATYSKNSSEDVREFLRTQWLYRFISLNVNCDGVLSLDDASWASRHLFTGYHRITDTGNDFIDPRMESQWDARVGKRSFDKTMDDFLAEYAASIFNNPIGFERLQRDCFYAAANIADVNGDVHISESEFVGWFRAYGINNGDEDKMLYALFEPHDDRVPISRIVDELVQFVCDTENIIQAVLNGA